MFDFLVNVFNAQGSAYVLGILGAFTPCTLAIFPIFLYRFGFGKNALSSKNLLGLLTALVSFVISFAITGMILQQFIVSDLANILRLTLGFLLVLGGVLQLGGALNLQFIQKSSNPILLGAGLPWILSFSPCVLSFTAGIILNSTSASAATSASTAWQFVQFGLGMITPVIIMVLFGTASIGFMRKFSNLIGGIEQLAPWILILAGIYLSSQLVQIASIDVLIVVILVLIIFTLVAYLVLKGKASRNSFNYLIASINVFLILTLGTVAYYITKPLDAEILRGEELLYSCLPGQHTNSPVAIPLAVIFTVLAVSVAMWYLNRNRKLRISLGVIQS